MNSKEENGHTLRRAVLYARVSTDEQAKKGYSITGQLDELRSAVEAQGYEIVAEVRDEGYGRETLERPGIDELYDLAESGSIDAVWAWQRDRYGASPCPEVLSIQLAGYGVDLRALDDVGEGEDAYLLHGLKDLMAKREIRQTVKRSLMGKRRKAGEGKVVAGAKIPFGFDLNERRDAYEVSEETMPVVRRIFYMVGEEGRSLHDVKRTFEAEGLRAPRGGELWSTTTIKKIILNDIYKPHDYEEVARMVSDTSGLDPNVSYGIWYYNKHYTATTRTVKLPGGDYKKRRTHRLRPREEWIAVPVPDAGIPLELVEAARLRVKANAKPPKKSNYRYWELAGGLLYCGECGRRMVGSSVVSKARGGKWFYYMCHRTPKSSGKDPCPNKRHKAEELEKRVRRVMLDLVRRPEVMRERIEKETERERERLKNPERQRAGWIEEINKIARKRDAYVEMRADGDITKEEFREKIAALDARKAAAEQELASLNHVAERIKFLDSLPDLVEEYIRELPYLIHGLPTHMRPYETLDPEEDGEEFPFQEITPDIFRERTDEEIEEIHRQKERERGKRYREMYETLGLTATVDKDGTLDILLGTSIVSSTRPGEEPLAFRNSVIEEAESVMPKQTSRL